MALADSATDPRSLIDAQTPAVGDVLAEMTRTVLARGGALHPGLTMVEREGALTVRCVDTADAAPDTPLFDIPREMLIPVDGGSWQDSPDSLHMLDYPPGLTALQRDLLDLHIALYNACEKLPSMAATHPRLALTGAPEVVSALTALRPSFRLAAGPDQPEDRTAPATAGTLAAGPAPVPPPPTVAAFLNTRVFSLPPITRDDSTPTGYATAASEPPLETSPTEAPANQRVRMPLIDLLNHHPAGAGFRVDALSMTPAVARPTGTTECFARYGPRRDTLDLAIGYAYLDRETRYARCPPLTVQVPNLGSVIVRSAAIRLAKSPLDPPTISYDDDRLALSHLVFRPSTTKGWQVPVVMALQARALQLGLSPTEARELGTEGARLIAERGAELIRDLRDTASPQAATNAAADLLAGAASRQLSILEDAARGL